MSINVFNQQSTHVQNVRHGRFLEYLTISWNLVEAIVAITAGSVAGSAALIGFGVDSMIESSSALTMLWRLRAGESGEKREQLALKLIGTSFLLLAAYLAFDAIQTLIAVEPPEISYPGMLLAVASLIIMPVIARAKRRVAANLNSRALAADSRQTDICAYLSAILLVGLGLNALFGWWWADAVAALVMVPIIVREGIEALRGEHCSDCH